MPHPQPNVALIDDRLRTAWVWHSAGNVFLRYEASLSAETANLVRTSAEPLRVFEPADNPTDALRRLSVASTRSYPDTGVTGFARLGLAYWEDRDPVGYLARLGGIRRATYSTTPRLLTLHVDNAVPPARRMGPFAVALEWILQQRAARLSALSAQRAM